MSALPTLDLAGRGRVDYATRGAGPVPILLLHGYGDSHYSFNGVLPALDARFTAYAPSQRGHGDSFKPQDDYAIESYAADALALMDALGLDSAVVAGHSMGSFIAQEIALQAPDRVRALILIGSATTSDNDALRGFHPETLALTDPVPRAFAHEFQAGTCANPLGPGMSLDRIVDESLKLPARVWDKALAGLMDYRLRDAPTGLEAIAAPTLILWGGRDEIFPKDEQAKLAAAIPGARLVIYETAGHGTQWEFPLEVAADINAFVFPSPD